MHFFKFSQKFYEVGIIITTLQWRKQPEQDEVLGTVTATGTVLLLEPEPLPPQSGCDLLGFNLRHIINLCIYRTALHWPYDLKH